MVTASGRRADFHSLRMTFSTLLTTGGIPLRTVQALMRHSDPRLTADQYTDLALLDTEGALGALPSFPLVAPSSSARATGTAGPSPETDATRSAPESAPAPGKPCRFVSLSDALHSDGCQEDSSSSSDLEDAANTIKNPHPLHFRTRDIWRTRRDSNAEPMASKATTLSN